MKFLLALLAGGAVFAQGVERPKVLGVAHMAIYVKDLAKTRQFYQEFLGFAEPFTLPKQDGTGVRIAFVKVNDNQYIEIFTEPDRGEASSTTSRFIRTTRTECTGM
jgi:catechol 2,3-dioxygenase-like lactoylglutathione lyase family enzyme